MHRVLASLLVGLIVVVILSRPAQAQDHAPARLVYQRATELEEACPDRQGLVDLVAGRLGYDPFADDAKRELEVSLVREGSLVKGVLILVEADGHRGRERSYTEPVGACRELASTLALTASILLDPTSLAPKPRGTDPTPSRDAGLPTPTPENLDRPPEDPPPLAPPPAEPQFRGRIGVGLLGTAFAEPGPSVGFAVLGGVLTRRFSIDVEGRADLPRSTTTHGLRGSTSLLLATLAPCLRFGAVVACVLGSLGALQGSVEAGTMKQSRSSFCAAAGVRLGAELPIGDHLLFRFHGDALATLTRTSLEATALEGASPITVWTTPPLSVALGLGAVYVF